MFESLIRSSRSAWGSGWRGSGACWRRWGLIIGAKIAFLHARHPLRFRWAWDIPTASRLMKVGLPILANTAAFGAVVSLDRMLILWRVPDGDRAAGLYTIAIMGTSWSLDLAGRIVTVLYTYFQTTLGRTSDPAEVARQALRATEGQAPLLASRQRGGVSGRPGVSGSPDAALSPTGSRRCDPLLPGTLLLGLAWPARQMLIAIGRPYTLALATLLGLGVADPGRRRSEPIEAGSSEWLMR